jgi:hypothetical protein
MASKNCSADAIAGREESMSDKVGLVIPTLNEEPNIGTLLDRVRLNLNGQQMVRGNIRSVTEIPYHFGQRYAGKSKVSLRVGLDYLVLLGRPSRSAVSRSGSS